MNFGLKRSLQEIQEKIKKIKKGIKVLVKQQNLVR